MNRFAWFFGELEKEDGEVEREREREKGTKAEEKTGKFQEVWTTWRALLRPPSWRKVSSGK